MKRLLPFVALLLVALSILAIAPYAYAVPKQPRPVITCFVTTGVDPRGVFHAASFYRLWMAKRQAAAWILAGWTSVVVGPC